MIYFYLYVLDDDDSNPSFHKEQFPAIAARSGFGWMFSHISTRRLQMKTFTQRKKIKTVKNNSNSSLLMLHPDRSPP